MLKYYSKVGHGIFLAPDGASGGGGSGPQGSPATGQGGHGGQPVTPVSTDPFEGIDLDDLPPEVKEKLVKLKTGFATLQTNSQQSAQQLEAAQKTAREFQSRHDKIVADMQRMTGQGPQNPQQNAQQQLIAQVEKILVEKGIPPEQAKLQAPIHAELLALQGETIKREIGTGLQPMVGSMLQQAALGAWQNVQQSDRLGALQIPEVAEATWQGVQHLVQQGQEVTPDIVRNLRNMHYSNHIENTGANPPPTTMQPPPQQQQPIYPQMNTRFTYPGVGGFVPPPVTFDPNAPKTTLNADTHAALAATFARMGTNHIPKNFQKK